MHEALNTHDTARVCGSVGLLLSNSVTSMSYSQYDPALAPAQARARGQAWEHGGYSDDLIVAAQCSRHGLHILCPAFALYPQWCAARPRWRAPAAPAN
jgi:hypothetical protein